MVFTELLSFVLNSYKQLVFNEFLNKQNFQTSKREKEFKVKDFRDNAHTSFENIKKEIEIKMKSEKSILDKDYKKLTTAISIQDQFIMDKI